MLGCWRHTLMQVFQQQQQVTSTASRAFRCFSGFSFSQPTRRDRNFKRDRNSQPPAYTEQPSEHQQGTRQQQHQQQRWQAPDVGQRQIPRQRTQELKDSLAQQYEFQYLITCHPGLEKVTAVDLQECCQHGGVSAAVEVTAPGRITMRCSSLSGGYAAVLQLRSATRVLQLIHTQQLDPTLPAGHTVYEATRAAARWSDLLAPSQTLGVHCLHFYNNSNVTNSQLVTKRVRDAVCDAVRDERGTRPAPPEGSPDLPLAFQMLNDTLELYRDVGGGSLHRRGYRSDSAVHKAALNEAAAAGLLLLAGWKDICKQQQGAVCVDPMCGSGTLLIEAALIATDTAPGLLRNTRANPWPFLHWPDSQQQQWQQLVGAAQHRAREGQAAWAAAGGRLLGNDCHAGALKLARQAAQSAGVTSCISLHEGQCEDWRLPLRESRPPDLVVCNPPWGLRLLPGDSSYQQQQDSYRGGGHSSSSSNRGSRQTSGPHAGADVDHEDRELVDSWQQLSHFLKDQCPGGQAWVLSGNPEMSRHLGMRASSKKAVRLGGQKTVWLQYSIRERL